MAAKRYLLFIFVLLVSVVGHAQKFKYANYGGEDIPFKKVNQVIQDVRGYAWVGTDQGLFRFDGTSFEDFNTTLRSRTIRAFIHWDENTLLFTNDTGIFRIIYENGKPVIEPFRSSNNLKYATDLFRDSNERLWVAQLDGSVLLFPDQGDMWKQYSLSSHAKNPHIFFGEDKFGTVWTLVPGTGVYYFDEISREFRSFGEFPNAKHFLVDGEILWIVADQIIKVSVTQNKSIEERRTFATDKNFKRIAKNGLGTLFLATESELYSFQSQQNNARIKKVFGSNDPHRVEELPYRTINHLYFTLDEMNLGDVIWVGSDNGLVLLWSSFFQTVSGMAKENVLGLNATDNGQILVSLGMINRVSTDGSLMRLNKEDHLKSVRGITSYKDNIWYSSTEGHILHYRANQLLRTHDLTQRGAGIFFMYADDLGDVWFCQAPAEQPIVGVAKLTSTGLVKEYGREAGIDNRILVVREGGQNELYAAGIGTSSYLYKYDRLTDSFRNKSQPFPFKVSGNFEVHDMAVDRLGIVWLATTDGLLKYDTESIRKVDLGEFTDGEVRSVSAMPNGVVWLSTDTNGLIHLDTDGNYVLFDEKCGTPSKVASYRSLVLDSNAQLWIGTAEGAVYSSQSIPGPLETKSPILKSAYVDNEAVNYDKKIKLNESETLKLGMRTLTFPSINVIYQYKVFESNLPSDEVQDIAWEKTKTSQLGINALEEGKYKVLVRALKEGGYSWSKAVELDVEVTRKWYKRWWSILLLGLLGIVFLRYFARRWFLRQIGGLQASLVQKQKELSLKEAELASQTNLIRDQKDELKSAGANVYLLHKLITQIPKNANWKEIIPVLGRLVEMPTGIDAFYIARKKGEDIAYSGYQRGSKAEIGEQEDFNEKENLASHVIVSGKPIVINDYDNEVTQFITAGDSLEYSSRLFIPFEQKNGSTATICSYSREKNAFTQREVTLIKILATFLSVNASDELK